MKCVLVDLLEVPWPGPHLLQGRVITLFWGESHFNSSPPWPSIWQSLFFLFDFVFYVLYFVFCIFCILQFSSSWDFLKPLFPAKFQLSKNIQFIAKAAAEWKRFRIFPSAFPKKGGGANKALYEGSYLRRLIIFEGEHLGEGLGKIHGK